MAKSWIGFLILSCLLGTSFSSFALGPFGFLKKTTASSCPNSGASVGGYCWYAGALGQSCTTVCSGLSLVYNAATLSYAGSSGSDANCLSVLNALSLGAAAVSTQFDARGCQASNANVRKRGTLSTTAGASNATWARACSCEAADYSLDPVNWANFENQSTILRLTGINTSVTLSISATNGTGSPTLYYVKNGTATSFTTGSPGSVSMVSGDTLALRMGGTNTHSANFTITNTSDGNTVVDTVTGTVNCVGGYLYNGHCFFLSASGANCVSTCSTKGGCLIAGIWDTGESLTNCNAAMTGLGVSLSGSSDSGTYPQIGCGVNGSGDVFFDMTSIPAPGCSPSVASHQRACPCGPGGITATNPTTISYLGYTFRLGNDGESCDTVCTGYGGCNATGTSFANSINTCGRLLSHWGNYSTSSNSLSGAGCTLNIAGDYPNTGSPATCAAATSGEKRVCACGP